VTRRGLLVFAAALIAAPSLAHEAPPTKPAFALPEPGSYELPAIARVSDFALLDERGGPARLLDLAPDQVAVVSFVYTRCGDGSHGCPAAHAVLQRLDRAIAAAPDLAGRVRLVTASFDPAHDTPPRMAALREALAPRGDWRFLTAPSPASRRCSPRSARTRCRWSATARARSACIATC
jgi:cytochrome oxidase Cu insertion factor (SCO1/SenC/PrrC family)